MNVGKNESLTVDNNANLTIVLEVRVELTDVLTLDSDLIEAVGVCAGSACGILSAFPIELTMRLDWGAGVVIVEAGGLAGYLCRRLSPGLTPSFDFLTAKFSFDGENFEARSAGGLFKFQQLVADLLPVVIQSLLDVPSCVLAN